MTKERALNLALVFTTVYACGALGLMLATKGVTGFILGFLSGALVAAAFILREVAKDAA